MMVGLPRSGKSTWVRRNGGGAAVICPDDIRKEILGHDFHKPAEDFVWAIAKFLARVLIPQGFNVILDATSVTRESRRPWISLAKSLGAKTKIVFLPTKWKKCLGRNRGTNRKVPDETIKSMASYFDRPTDGEADEVVIIGRKTEEKAAACGRRTV